MNPDILDHMTDEQREDEEYIARMYAQILHLHGERKRRLVGELAVRVRSNIPPGSGEQ